MCAFQFKILALALLLKLPKMFESFYTTKSDGMGVGLSVSRSIIEANHGRLWATANDGPGATLCILNSLRARVSPFR
jgi:signal transduction histidine kinase